MTEDYRLIDNIEEQQYEFHIDRYRPKIEYLISKDSEILFTHTEVPLALEGHGIGTQLVEKSLQNVEDRGLWLVPLCPFVVGYIRKHPEWERIVTKSATI